MSGDIPKGAHLETAPDRESAWSAAFTPQQHTEGVCTGVAQQLSGRFCDLKVALRGQMRPSEGESRSLNT
jgi:hypothetical protein